MNRARANASLIARSMTGGRGAYKRDYAHSSFADQADLTDKQGGGLTLSRSAGSIYYFNGSGILTSTGDNVAAFTSNGLFVEGQATNLISAANYRDVSGWNLLGVTMKATTPTLIDGTTGASGKNEIQEDGLNSTHRVYANFTAASSEKQSAMVAIKRGTGSRHVNVRLNNSTDGNYGQVAYNLDTLATIGTVTAEYTTAYVKGGYTIIELVDTNTTTGTQLLVVDMHNGSSTTYTGDSASTLIIDWAQVVSGGHAQSHIQGAATRYASLFSRPWIGAVNNFWIYVDVYPKFTYNMNVTNSLMFFALYTSANDYLRCRIPSAGIATLQTETNDNPNYQTVNLTSFTFARGNRIRIVATYDAINGLRVRCNMNNSLLSGSVSTYKANMPDLKNATFALLNYDGVTAGNVFYAECAGYRVGTGILTTAQMADLVGI